VFAKVRFFHCRNSPKRPGHNRESPQVQWVRDLSVQAEQGIEEFMKCRAQVATATNIDDAMKAISGMLEKVATCKAELGKPLILGLCDFNVASSTFGESIEQLVNFMNRIISLNPQRSAVLTTTPDKAKDSSKRGLADEESAIEQEVWTKRLWCDQRSALQIVFAEIRIPPHATRTPRKTKPTPEPDEALVVRICLIASLATVGCDRPCEDNLECPPVSSCPSTSPA